MASIQDLLAKGETGRALAQLQEHILNKAPKWRQPIQLLRASWAQLEKEHMQGIISGEEAGRRRNRINAAALQLLENVESGLSSPEELWKELKGQFWNENIAETMKKQEQNRNTISDSSINIQGSSDVVVGSGNTVTKKIVNALGRWQFWGILVVLGGLGAFGYFGGQELLGRQEAAYASLSEIRQELAALAEEKGESFQAKVPEIEAQARSGLKALKKGDYQAAIKELSAAADEAPLASLYKGLAHAYEQEGNFEKAYEMRNRALQIDPEAYAPRPVEELLGKRVNLLASENGPVSLVESDQVIRYAMNGSISGFGGDGRWMVIGFPEERTAIIDQIDTYVKQQEYKGNCAVEVLVSQDSPVGEFKSVAKFKPVNAHLTKQPFQSFAFEPVEAKYVRIALHNSGCRFRELRLWGRLQ